jgi:ribosomal protein S18 acetylase RimI-like enzyme
MNSAQVITRVAERHWHALDDDLVVGRGHASQRPDGRVFVSIDSWHDAVFDQLAATMLADLPTPLYTVVDEFDLDLATNWRRAGFTTGRREWELSMSTDPGVTGLGSALLPGVTIVPVGAAQEGPLHELDRLIRDEVEATVGWQTMPAEVLPRPVGATVLHPSRYAVAARGDRYVGLVRVAPLPRQPRIGLIAVLAQERRRGIARALLGNVFGALHRDGVEAATVEVHENNAAALALFAGIGARRAGSNLELVLR